MADGILIFDTKIDISGFQQDAAKLEKSTDSVMGKLNEKIAATLSAKTVKAAKAVLDFGKESVLAASSLQETQSLLDATFGKNTYAVDNWAKSAQQQFGLTEAKAKQSVLSMNTQLKSTGLSDTDARQMSTQLTGLAADMASFYNLDFGTVFQGLQSGMAGNADALSQMGICLSEANLEAFALSKGMKQSYRSLSEAEQAALRYQYVIQETADVQGDFVQNSDGLANGLTLLESNWDTLKTHVGEALLPLASSAVNLLNGLFENGNKSTTFTVEAQAEIEQAQNDLNTLGTDIQSLKDKYLSDQIGVNVTVTNATVLSEEIEGMFAVTPKLKDWDESAKEDAINILGELNEMIPGFKYTPDEEGLQQLQDDLAKEQDAVSATVSKYGELEKARNANKYVEAMKARLADAEANVIYLAAQRKGLARQKEYANRRTEAFQYLYEQSNVNADPASPTVALKMAGSASGRYSYAGMSKEVIADGLDLLNAFLLTGESLNDLADASPNKIDIGKLLDDAGNLKSVDMLAGDEEPTNRDTAALEVLYDTVMAINGYVYDKSESEQEKSVAFAEKIAEIDTTLDTNMQEVEELRQEVATAQTMADQLADETPLDEIVTGAKAATEEPYTFSLEADDQATSSINGVEQELDSLNGKSATVVIRTILSGGSSDDTDGSFASGLSRVPFDGFIAELHEGEAVLTKAEASLWRAGWAGARGAGSAVSPASAGSAGGGAFSQINNFNVPVQTPDEFAKTMHLYATYGMEGVI